MEYVKKLYHMWFPYALWLKLAEGDSFVLYLLISVGSWNFKDGGSLKANFLAKNQHATKEKSLKNSYD